MELNIVIIILSAIAGWFALQGAIDIDKVSTHNQDDMHWIAAAAMTTLILFMIGLITAACIVQMYTTTNICPGDEGVDAAPKF